MFKIGPDSVPIFVPILANFLLRICHLSCLKSSVFRVVILWEYSVKPLIRKEKTCNPLRLQVFLLGRG
nr:MAG TPA: hypothetical protein [Caudoviricetes sp.]